MEHSEKKTELKKRTITALVILPIVAAIIYAGGLFFGIAIGLLLFQMLREFYAMKKHEKSTENPTENPTQNPSKKSSLTIAAIITSALCCVSILYIEEVGTLAIIWLACVIAATDIGAFAVGRTFGKNRIWARVSPNKTWEGAIGGFALAALVSDLFGQPAILGVLIGILAQMGDFAESAIKRKYGVKDSGNLLPGHGGVLDRIDGYLFAAPFAALLHLTGIVTW